jgi:hypothetical protein
MEIYTFRNIIILDYLTEILEQEDIDDENTYHYPINVLDTQYVGDRKPVLQLVVVTTDLSVDANRKIEIEWAKNATFDISTMNGLLEILIIVAENLEIRNIFDIYIKEVRP